MLILDPPNASNDFVVREEAVVPNLNELVAIANDISYNIKQSLVFVEEMQEVDLVFFSV